MLSAKLRSSRRRGKKSFLSSSLCGRETNVIYLQDAAAKLKAERDIEYNTEKMEKETAKVEEYEESLEKEEKVLEGISESLKGDDLILWPVNVS